MFPEVCCGEGTIRELEAFLKNESLFREPESFFQELKCLQRSRIVLEEEGSFGVTDKLGSRSTIAQ